MRSPARPVGVAQSRGPFHVRRSRARKHAAKVQPKNSEYAAMETSMDSTRPMYLSLISSAPNLARKAPIAARAPATCAPTLAAVCSSVCRPSGNWLAAPGGPSCSVPACRVRRERRAFSRPGRRAVAVRLLRPPVRCGDILAGRPAGPPGTELRQMASPAGRLRGTLPRSGRSVPMCTSSGSYSSHPSTIPTTTCEACCRVGRHRGQARRGRAGPQSCPVRARYC